MAGSSPPRRTPAKRAPRPAGEGEQHEAEQPTGPTVDMDRTLARMQVKAGQRETTITMLEVMIEERDELIAALRAELVTATSAAVERTSASS